VRRRPADADCNRAAGDPQPPAARLPRYWSRNAEGWWDEYGRYIEANWESAGLRRYSTLDRDAVTALILDPAWSNEGLFALLQGLRRLAEIGGDRTDLPAIEWET
jgi:hypothetical protein